MRSRGVLLQFNGEELEVAGRQGVEVRRHHGVFLAAHLLSPVGGGNAVDPPELPVEAGGRGIPHLEADLRHRVVAVVEQHTGPVDAHHLHIIRRGPAQYLLEQPPEVGGADVAEMAELLDGDLLHIILRDIGNGGSDAAQLGVDVRIAAGGAGAAAQQQQEQGAEQLADDVLIMQLCALQLADDHAEDGQGLTLFIRAIPFNFYAILTILMMVGIIVLRIEYGPMATHERNALEKGDLFSGKNPYASAEEEVDLGRGRVMDLILPIVLLVVCCVIGMIYSGGFFEGTGFIEAFSNSDASVGLVLGSAVAIVFAVAYLLIRRVISFKDAMASLPEGFKAMVPAILILTCAWTLKAMTDSLGAKIYISQLVEGSAGALQALLPAIIFLIAVGLSFATGTSWGTFGILIPIVLSVFEAGNPLMIVSISACMAGAVCGDHCSPISDTTIMASAGAQSDHLNHVSTQLPYALTVAGVSFVTYVIAGFVPHWYVALPVGAVLMVATLFVIKKVTSQKA